MIVQPSILVVEDDELDVIALQRAFKRAGLTEYTTHLAKDGREALSMLKGEEGHAAIPLPNVVLMDINMPRMNGHECLEAIRNDPQLSHLVVFFMTTSTDVVDIRQAYARQVAGYIVKSQRFAQFEQMAEMIKQYLELVVSPASA
ncbi:MAG: response regulator [Bradymonadia bacterium]